MRSHTGLTILASLILCAATLTFAQQAPTDDTSTLTSNTELVLVPAQVRGPDGKPLLGLKPADLILRSDGKPQPIRVFEEQSSSDATPPAAASRASNGATQKFSNVPEQGMPQQILIIAIDLVNTAFLDQTRAKQQLLKYLSEELPNRHFALVAITKHGLVQIHSFSSDPAVLVQALQRIQGDLGKDVVEEAPLLSLTFPSSSAFDPLPKDEYHALMNAFNDTQVYGVYAQKIAAQTTLAALQAIAQAYAGVPGRKSVIWLTGGMPTILRDPFAGGIKSGSVLNADPELLSDYDRAFQALNNANIAIYGIDVKGIKLDRTYLATGTEQAMHNPLYNGNSIYGPPLTVPVSSYDDDAIKVLSAATGGKSCTSNTELKTCITEAVDDSNSYYMLGFYVPQQNRKPGWHKLEVKLASGHGSVRSRSSYYLASTTSPTEKQINRTLFDAAEAKIGYTGLAFTVEREPLTQTASAPAAAVKIMVPPSSLVLTSGHPQLSYDIVTVPLTSRGEPAATLRVIHLNLTAEQTQTALMKGWSFSDPVQGTPAQAVKYIIRDNGTGHIGSLVLPPTSVGAGG